MTVSIHAPARGATSNCEAPCVSIVFRSTHPRGVRLYQGGLRQVLGDILN